MHIIFWFLLSYRRHCYYYFHKNMLIEVNKKCTLWNNGNIIICKGCSKTNSSYFIMLAHGIRGRWWHGSRGWTFLLISHYILLLCDEWQQRGSLTIWCLTRKSIWRKSVAEFLHEEKITSIGIHQCLLNIYGVQSVKLSIVRQWVVCFTYGDSDVKYSHVPDCHAHVIPWNEECLN